MLNHIKINLIRTKLYSYHHPLIFSMASLFPDCFIPIHVVDVPSFFEFPHLTRILTSALLLLIASISKICLYLSLSFHFHLFLFTSPSTLNHQQL